MGHLLFIGNSAVVGDAQNGTSFARFEGVRAFEAGLSVLVQAAEMSVKE